MGKGIALQFKRAFPANFHAYRAACARGEVRLGQVWTFDNAVLGLRRYILNFPTKGHWRGRSRLEDIAAGLDSLVQVVNERAITSIAIPALGCGNGGLRWSAVRPLIEATADRMPDVRVLVLPPEGAPAPAAMPNAMPAPTLTPLRAVPLIAIARYLDRARLQEVREGISELEIQKLAYFLQVLGTPLKLAFTRGTYGPYAPSLGHVLDSLEGHYLSGIDDRSAPVTQFAPINPLPRSVEAAETALRGEDEIARRIDKLLELVESFETPYSLELLATVHFASVQAPRTAEPAELADRVASWSLSKARMFTDKHVQVAAARLREHELLPA